MPTFLFSGTDAEGKKRHDRVDAENAQAAKAILAHRGWTDLQLLLDEICYSEVLKVESPNDTCVCDDDESGAEYKTPEAQASFYRGGWKTSVAGQTLKAIADSWKLILLSVALIGWGIYRHQWVPIVVGGLALGFAVLFIPIFHAIIRMFGTVRNEFRRMNQAKVWARWNEVLECVELLRKPDRVTGAIFPEHELIRSRAQALAGLGRLDEALVEFKKLENSPKLEHWHYLISLASVYDAARQPEKGLELRREAAAEKPESSMIWSDVAYSCVRRLNLPNEAREAIARAEQLEMSEIAKAHHFFVRGMILWREHKPGEAKIELEKALADFEARSHQPLVEGLILLTKSYLCAVNLEIGNTTKARALLTEVNPFLIAHKEEELLAACRGTNAAVALV